MSEVHHRARNYAAAAFTAALGIAVVWLSLSYKIGTFLRMGPGFFILVIGCLLLFCSLLLVATAHLSEKQDSLEIIPKLDVRGGACILAGILAFAIIGKYGGMMPAAFAAVFVSALGDRSTTVLQAAVLGVLVTLVGALVFTYLVGLPLPLLKWGA